MSLSVTARRRLSVSALTVAGALITVAVTVLVIEFPIAVVLIPLGVAAVIVAIRFGLLATITAAALGVLGVAGAAARFAPAAGALTQVAVLALIGLGIIGIFRVRVPPLVTVSGSAFLIIASIASVLVIDRSEELALRGWVSLVAAVFAAIAVASACKPARDGSTHGRTIVMTVLLSVVLLNVGFALRQALLGLTPQEIASARAAESTFAVGDQIRLMGLFPTNQDFGLFSACLAPALLVLAVSELKRRRWFMLVAVLAYFAILLSLTRTALVAAFGAGLLGLILWGRGRVVGRLVKTTFVLAVIGSLAFGVISSIDNARIQDSIARATTLLDLSGDTSFIARANRTLPRSFDAFFANPWGSGAGAAGPVSQQFRDLVPFGGLTTDNGYLLIAVQLGVFGLIAFVFMLVGLAVWLGKGRTAYSRAGSAAIIALLIAMLLAQYWGLLAPVSLAAAVVGIGIADRQSQRENTSAQSLDSGKNVWSPRKRRDARTLSARNSLAASRR